jgi:hypothetical protein
VDIAVGMFEGSGDKYRDVVVLQQGTGDVRYFVNNGSSLEQVGSFAVGVAPLELAAADFNADGYCDYAVLFKDNIQVLLGIDGKLFTSPQPVGPSSLGLKDPAALTVVDVNNDGKDDLAFVERAGNKVTMMLNTGTATFLGPLSLPVGGRPVALAAGSFGCDKCLDLVSANENGRSLTLLKAANCED